MSGVRMPDHVSPDTGRRLREAGLQWQPRVGDWCCCEAANGMAGAIWSVKREVFMSGPGPAILRLSVPVGENDVLPRTENASRCTWLPTTGQLLDLLDALNLSPQLTRIERGAFSWKWRIWVWLGANPSLKTPPLFVAVESDDKAEALAAAWLRVRAQEVQP